MLQVIPRKIDLKLFQRRYNVRITNASEVPFIFRIRTTNVKAFTVEPNVGFLRSQSTLSLLITVKSRDLFNEKIQISYAKINDQTMGYEKAWSQIKKKKMEIKSEIIEINLNNSQQQEPQTESLLESSPIIQKTPPPRKISIQKKLEGNLLGQFPSKRDQLQIMKSQQAFKQYITTGTKAPPASKEKLLQHYQKQKKRHYDDEQKQELLYRLEELQRKYSNQLNHSQRLKQQLQITEAKIKDSSVQGLKYQINQTLGTICDEHHTSFTGLALIALTAFFLGYLFALFV